VVSNCPYVEYLPAALHASELRWNLVRKELTAQQGRIELPDRPGLGAEINDEAIDRFRVI
jgi:L-alanine-DL-glutamate epimerase-like enolase superfamily enzyme